MNFHKKFTVGAILAMAATFSFAIHSDTKVEASNINTTYALGANEGSSQRTSNKVIIAHAAGVYAPGINIAMYEKRSWYSNGAYVQYSVGDGGKIYKIGEEGYVSWGAGSWANANAPVQIELAQTYNDAEFKKDYVAYVNLLRDSAKKWKIPLTLDSSAWTGIKSHVWISNNVWGDHVDPYGYLASHGVSKAKFKYDVEHGFGSSSNSNKNTKPATKPSKPSTNNKAEKRDYAQNGTLKFNRSVKVYSNVNGTGKAVATYNKGQSVNYDHVFIHDNQVWGRYTSYSGAKRYFMMGIMKGASYGTRTIAKSVSHTYHTVQYNESWWSIANANGMSMYQLASKNGKTINSMIYPGQRLVVS